MLIGHKLFGNGTEKVIILHDWFCDISSYDNMLPYLDQQYFTYAFMDVRGYGTSKNIDGTYNIDEIVNDIVALADNLKWEKFHVIGHSMTGMAVQKLTVRNNIRIKSAILITPVPACGAPADEKSFNFMKEGASNNTEYAYQIANMMSGSRCGEQFLNYKVKRWHETSLKEARIAYLSMFSYTDFAKEVIGNTVPMLVIAGEYDIESFKANKLQDTIIKWYPNSELVVCSNAAHYPMQETPVHLAGLIENFMKKFS